MIVGIVTRSENAARLSTPTTTLPRLLAERFEIHQAMQEGHQRSRTGVARVGEGKRAIQRRQGSPDAPAEPVRHVTAVPSFRMPPTAR